MRFRRVVLALAGAAVLATGTTTLLPATAQARIMAVACDETSLITAVNAANAAGGGTVTLTAGCTYTLTAAHGNDGVNGPTGLPIITTPITLEGNANTITRSSASVFRIAQVSTTGDLTLKAVTLSGGHAATNGGGILNFGAVTLTGSELSNNAADGTGGGIYSTGGAAGATFTSSNVKNNTAHQAAGIANDRGTLALTSSVVSGNAAAINPGGIYHVAGSATLDNSAVSANTPTNCTGSPSPVPGCTG
ncbi:hypothetical protein [Streptomyces sp. QHH-9511]|uniref:hypothetical protein n=1 Tax=Streptomyces sp. QHH-9511 TaxID=2684468 RepID=UPI001E3BBC71|nr:hypothetical protein [Streptomyces sp. QHH-9511]